MEYLIYDVEATTFAKGNPYSKPNEPVLLGFKSSIYGYVMLYRDADVHRIIDLVKAHDYLVGFNLKYDLGWLLRLDINPDLWYNLKLWDAQLYFYLETNQKNAYPSLNQVSEAYGGERKFEFIKENYWDKGIDTIDIPKDELILYNKQDLDVTEQCFLHQYKQRMNDKQKFTLFRVQQEDQKMLLEMEYNGMLLDVQKCKSKADKLEQDIDNITDKVKELYDHFKDVPIKLSSNDHKSALLYGGTITETVPVLIGVYKTGVKAGLPKYKNTDFVHELPRLVNPLPKSELAKEGYYATDDKTLRSLNAKGKIKTLIDLLLERAKLSKLLGTYFLGFPKKLEDFGWENNTIHSSLNQCKVITGRLSSDKPNQQNLPSIFKECFITRFS